VRAVFHAAGLVPESGATRNLRLGGRPGLQISRFAPNGKTLSFPSYPAPAGGMLEITTTGFGMTTNGTLSASLGSGQFEILRARSLAPLVKARGFGMTYFKTRTKLTYCPLLAKQSFVHSYARAEIPSGGCAVSAATAGSDVRKVGSVGVVRINLCVFGVAAGVEGSSIVDDAS
jgi:hypothetical protein